MSYSSQINAVFGSKQANSYVTVEEATTTLSQRHGGSAWEALEGDRPESETLKFRERLLMTATNMIDSQTYRYGRFFSWQRGFPHTQGLKFPWSAHPYLYLRTTSGTTNTIVCQDLENSDFYSDDFFFGGSVQIRRGTGKNSGGTITGYDAATGTLTLKEDLDQPVDSTTEFYLIWPPDSALKDAVIEQAYHLLLANPSAQPGELDERAELAASGVTSYSISGVSESFGGNQPNQNGGSPVLCNMARLLLRPYMHRSLNAGRA